MYGILRYLSLIKPLLMSHITAVLSTDPDTMKFPSRVQQMSYTSSMCPLKTNQIVRNLLKPRLIHINILQTANCKMNRTRRSPYSRLRVGLYWLFALSLCLFSLCLFSFVAYLHPLFLCQCFYLSDTYPGVLQLCDDSM